MKIAINPAWGRWLLRRRLIVYLIFSVIVYGVMELCFALWDRLPESTEGMLRDQVGFSPQSIIPGLLSLLTLLLIPICVWMAVILFGYLGRMIGLYVKPQVYFMDMGDHDFRVYHPGTWIARKIPYERLVETTYKRTPTALIFGFSYKNPRYSLRWSKWVPMREVIHDVVYISNDVYVGLKNYISNKAPDAKIVDYENGNERG